MYNWVPGDWCLRLPMSYDFTMYSHNHLTRHFDTSPLGWKQPVQPAIFPTFVGKALTLLVAVPMYLVYSEIPIVVSFNSIVFLQPDSGYTSRFRCFPCLLVRLFFVWSMIRSDGFRDKKISSNPFFTGWIPYSSFQIYSFSMFFLSNPRVCCWKTEIFGSNGGGEERFRSLLGRLEAHGETRLSSQQRDLLLRQKPAVPVTGEI